ncbi:MAG: peptidyl-prolyl cis-trans isomerase, partial [Verrucomicrobiota bacterium]|nr:peptidyl-prolyl cis-trans isomerase [Verrucomicrobiota bacterium]
VEKGAVFDQVAAKFQLPVQVSGEFSKSQSDPVLKAAGPALASAAFQLTPEDPNSDAVQGADGFYIMHLNGIDPARPLTLEEAKPKIVAALKGQRTTELLANKAAEVKSKIADALKAGTPLATAAQQTGLTVEKISPFALADPPQPVTKPEPGKEAPPPEAPDLQAIKSAVAELSPGEVSEVVPTQDGTLVAVLEKREPPAPGAYEAAKQSLEARFKRAKEEVAFSEWLRERRREAGIVEPVEPRAG